MRQLFKAWSTTVGMTQADAIDILADDVKDAARDAFRVIYETHDVADSVDISFRRPAGGPILVVRLTSVVKPERLVTSITKL